MKSIKITKSCTGSNDGVHVIEFEPSDDAVEVSDDLAKAFVEDMKTAEYVDEVVTSEDLIETPKDGLLANMEWASNADITELRVFADKHDIKHRSLDGLMNELLEANLLTDDGGYAGE